MSKVIIDSKINPDFILYNLVFSSNPLPTVDEKNIVACMKAYGIKMAESHIRERLNEWYNNGLLRKRDGHYVVT